MQGFRFIQVERDSIKGIQAVCDLLYSVWNMYPDYDYDSEIQSATAVFALIDESTNKFVACATFHPDIVHLKSYGNISNTSEISNVDNAEYKVNTGTRAVLLHLAVHKDYRGRGIAKYVMRQSMMHDKLSDTTLLLKVHENNHVAMNLYDSLGFDRCEYDQYLFHQVIEGSNGGYVMIKSSTRT